MPNSVKRNFSASFRQSFLDELKNNPQSSKSILIIGGGIVGAGLARELALAGAKEVLLVEKKDFASGTSGASSKLIHAGIRYLEQSWNELKALHFGEAIRRFLFVWDASRERKILGRIAGNLVKPKNIHFVIGKGDQRAPAAVWLGNWFYYALQILQGQFFSPPSSFFSQNSIKKNFPDLSADQVKAVFSFVDSETEDALLTLETLRFAFSEGIDAVNYVEVVSAQREEGGWRVDLRDKMDETSFSLRADFIINATGPFLDQTANLMAPNSQNAMIDRVAGCHVDIYPCPVSQSYYVTAQDGRLVFVLRRGEREVHYARIGTTERPLASSEASDNPQASSKEVDYLKALVGEFFPLIKFDPESIKRIDEGIRPLTRHDQKENSFEKSREHKLIWQENLLHVAGVKLTDFRRVASEILSDRRFGFFLPNKPKGSRTRLLRNEEITPLFELVHPEEVAQESMVVTWEDYYERRQGLLPRIKAGENQGALREDFQRIQKVLSWPDSEFKTFPVRRGEAAEGGEPL